MFELLAKELIQLPKAAIEVLIFFASSKRIPSLPDLDIRSEPARSTIVRSPFL